MITIESSNLVNLINDLIEEAVCDGADSGGAYHQNTDELIITANNLLKCLGLFQYYEAIKTDDYSNWSNIKVVERK